MTKMQLLSLLGFSILKICTALDDDNDDIDVIFEKLNNITDEFNVRAKIAVSNGAAIVTGAVPRSDIEDQLKKSNTSQTLRVWLERFITTEGNVSSSDMSEVIDLYSSAEKAVFTGLYSLYGYITNGNVSSDDFAYATHNALHASQDVSLLTSHLFMNLVEFVELFNPTVGLDNLVAGTPASLEEYTQLNDCLQQQQRNHTEEAENGRPCYVKAIKAAEGILRDVETFLN